MHNPSQAGKCHMTKETTSFTTLVNFANTPNMENLSYKKPLNISSLFTYFCSLSEVSGRGCVGGRIDGHKCDQTIYKAWLLLQVQRFEGENLHNGRNKRRNADQLKNNNSYYYYQKL